MDLRDCVEFIYEDHIVWAVVKDGETILARERVPIHYLKSTNSPTLAEFYMQEISHALRKKLEKSGKMPDGQVKH